jgi:long-chain acyl-CoA synthetase
MLGYYKNEEATRQTLDAEGWYHTGDLGTMDANGNVFIKGRSKNMLLSANGENIYPEEIEDKINSMPMVVESVVVQREDKLVALVYPEIPDDLDMNKRPEIPELIRTTANKSLPGYSKINEVVFVDEPFEKTPKMSIKRYLYR